jgi:hypothetical protein
MHRIRILGGLLLCGVLMVPVAATAGERRYYDRDGHDYHQWNDHEDHAYRVYLGERHQPYREFSRVRAVHQREYFKWRHEHPDSAIVNVEVR